MPEEMRLRMIEWTTRLPLGSTTGFEQYGDSVFWEGVPAVYRQHPEALEFKEFLDSKVFEQNTEIRAVEVSRLGVGHSVDWHTDGQNKKVYGPIVCLRHRVHVYLDGQAVIQHRRDWDGPKLVMEEQQLGEVLLFNDYVWHRVSTKGDKPRLLLAAQVWDRDWSIKKRIYERYNLEHRRGY